MNSFEETARSNHRSGMNCAASVYGAFADVNKNKTAPPMPRSDGGMCGTVLAAERIIREMGGTSDMTEDFDKRFIGMFGSLKCAELRGMLKNKCNDYVGEAAAMVAEMMNV